MYALINHSNDRVYVLIENFAQSLDTCITYGVSGNIAVILPVQHQRIKQNLGETLRTIKAKYGVFAVTGNHEYIGGVEEAYKYLMDHGIRVLRDEVVTIDGGITLVGREDRSIGSFSGKKRKSLRELMANVDKRFPVILMDHQPIGLNEAVEAGADLQLSGHTHHGQIWPFGYITEAIYEVSWGYKKKGETQFYVSSGVGTWGPPVRLGNTPEIINLRSTFGPNGSSQL